MSVQPVWITPAGTLGTLPQGVFYSVPLQAYLPNSTGTIYYQLISGQLPYGLAINAAGIIAGTPQSVIYVDGVATEVSYNVSTTFAIRAYTTKVVNTVTVVDRFCDQTFIITVAGAGTPQWVTLPGQIAFLDEGTVLDPGIQLEYTDNNTADTVTVALASGELPPGLTVDSTGLITGYVGLIPGTADTEYTFTMAVTNGTVTNLRTFSIMVGYLAVVPPLITNPQGSIGITRNLGYFAYQFNGVSLYGDTLVYDALTPLPPGLILDPDTGWLYGDIPNTGLTQTIYSFQIEVYPAGSPGTPSDTYTYSLTVEGLIATGITWLVPNDLGTINTGEPSTLYVAAVDVSNIPLQYQLDPSSTNELPPGLAFQPDGTITGTVSFDLFTIDSGTTIFDNNTTTFDLTYTFTVEAYSANGAIDVFNTFTIEVNRTSYAPYNNLYIKCMPSVAEFSSVQSFLTNPDIFPNNLIYRPGDSNFGVAKNIIYYHAYGLTATTLDAYVRSLSENHYWKHLTLGQLQTARALDNNGNTLYEVIYSEVVDDLVNNLGETVDKTVVLPYPVNPGLLTEITAVYPNGLVDMRNQVIDQIGQVSNILPRWMLSKQTDGTVLGFTPAWVIAYCKPGTSGQILYNIEQVYPDTFNTINFKADRYELDRSLSANWDPDTQKWDKSVPGPTTFDTNYHYQFNPANVPMGYIATSGTGYAIGDRIRVLGTDLGAATPANDVIVTVYSVGTSGEIAGAFCSGFAVSSIVGLTFNGVGGTNINGTGSGATFDFTAVDGVTTYFDGGSCQFINPGPTDGSDQYDAYMMYPKYNVIEKIPQVGNTYPVY